MTTKFPPKPGSNNEYDIELRLGRRFAKTGYNPYIQQFNFGIFCDTRYNPFYAHDLQLQNYTIPCRVISTYGGQQNIITAQKTPPKTTPWVLSNTVALLPFLQCMKYIYFGTEASINCNSLRSTLNPYNKRSTVKTMPARTAIAVTKDGVRSHQEAAPDLEKHTHTREIE